MRTQSKSNNSKTTDNVQRLKIPPHSVEAEQSVLGGLLLSKDAWEKVSDVVVADDFYKLSHRLIFSAIERLNERSDAVDIISVSEYLGQRDNELEEAGGFAYLGEIAKNTPSVVNIVAYAKIVRERAVTREMIGAANEIADIGYDPQGKNADEMLNEAEQKIFDIAEKRTEKGSGPEDIQALLGKTIDKLEELVNNPNDGITGVTTGFTDLDKMTAGMQPSDLIIVAARPSMGKTTFAMNLCENAALSEKRKNETTGKPLPVLIFSLEMPAEQIMFRMLSSLSRVNQTNIRTGDLDDEEWAKISGTIGRLNDDINIYIDDSSGLTPTELRSRARRVAKENGGISMIMVDYLQLMQVPGNSENRTLEIAEISRSLKALAKELTCPVVALSQLNRGLEQRSDKRPVNSDLRESGAIEQDADLIMFIYRDEVYNENSEYKGIAEIIIGKQRNGPIGTARLTFQGQFSRFDNYAGPAFDEPY